MSKHKTARTVKREERRAKVQAAGVVKLAEELVERGIECTLYGHQWADLGDVREKCVCCGAVQDNAIRGMPLPRHTITEPLPKYQSRMIKQKARVVMVPRRT